MTNSRRTTKRFTLDLCWELHRKLRFRAVEEGRSAAEICRELIERYLGDHETQADARLQAAYQAGVRAERERIGQALQTGRVGGGLPTQRPSLPPTV